MAALPHDALSRRPPARPTRRSCAIFPCGAALCALLTACHGSLPAPPSGPVPPDALLEIPYPPPPARVQTVPPPKQATDVWIDGQWTWSGKEWKWGEGAWVTPPPNAYFTGWKVVLREDGRFLFAAAAWRAMDGRPLDFGAATGPCAAPATSNPPPLPAPPPRPSRSPEGPLP